MRARPSIRQIRSRHRLVIEVLDAVGRTRALSDAESEQLEAAIRREEEIERTAARTRLYRVSENQRTLIQTGTVAFMVRQ